MIISLEHYIVLSILLLSLGIGIIISKRNLIMVLIGLELILNAANINFVAVSNWSSNMHGEVIAIFVMVIAVSEAAVALAIVLQLIKQYKTSDLDEIKSLREE